MSEPTNLTDAGAAFLRAEAPGEEGAANDRRNGMRICFRLNDASRVQLLSSLIMLWLDGEELNRAVTGGFFREAWESEPNLDGLRAGSHFSAVAASTPGGAIWSMDQVAEDWGRDMMAAEERAALGALPAKLTAYRGGTGPTAEVGMGVSWSLDPAVARFYAEIWPGRRGCVGPPVVLTLQIERDEIAALFTGREESEVLIPCAGYRVADMRVVDPVAGPTA